MMFKHYFKKDVSVQKGFAELCPLNCIAVSNSDLPTSLVQTVIILETFHGTDAYTHMHILKYNGNN
jgi:hypothetical protein